MNVLARRFNVLRTAGRGPRKSRRHRPVVTLAALAATAAISIAFAADAPPDPTVALERAVADQPEDAVLAYYLGLFRARAGNRDGALDALDRVLTSGKGFLPPIDLFDALKDDRRFAVLRARFEKRLPVKTDGRVAYTLPDRKLLPEGIAYDPVARSLYVGSIARTAIYRVERAGTLRKLSSTGDELDAVLGLAIDAKTRTLYAVSTSALTERGRASPRNRILVYDLKRSRLRQTIDVPDARQLNDVAVGPDGTLLVTDSAGGGVWRVDPSRASATALVPLGSANGANGIAIAPGGDVAYVGAARRPLRVDVATGTVTPLQPPGGENAAGIDGLYWHDGALIGIQNVTTPARVIRIALTGDGRSITSIDTLQSHHQAAFVEPTTAAIAPDGLYVLARTHVTQFNDQGTIDRPQTLTRPQILRIPLPRK